MSDDRPTAFVLMPFDNELDAVYSEFIRSVLQEVGYKVVRADDLVSQQNILRDVIDGISSSDLIVADLTGSNPNVYYEVGIAHALRKQVVLMAQDLDEVPFDLRSYRIVRYGVHFSDMARAREELSRLVSQAIAGEVSFGSPVTDFQPEPPSEVPLSRQADRREHAPDDVEGERGGDIAGGEANAGGFLDHLVDMEEGFEELKNLAERISTETQRIGTRTAEQTALMDRSTSAKVRRKLIRELALDLHRYGSTLAAVNTGYRTALDKTAASLEAVLSADARQSDAEALRNFIATMESTKGGADGAKGSMASFRDTMQSVGNIERDFNRARNLSVRELGNLVENLELTVAMMSRAQEIARLTLERINPTEVVEPASAVDGPIVFLDREETRQQE